MAAARLSRRELNRATLARQGLLAPIPSGSIPDAVARAGSLRAQHPEWPPVALWTRAGDRAITGLPQAISDRSVVRAALMRITVHVVAATDFWPMSALAQPLRRAQFRSFFKADAIVSPLGRRLTSAHAAVRAALHERPLRIRDMDAIMAAELPELVGQPNRMFWRHIAASMPLVHVPFDGEGHGRSRYALADDWLGAPPDALDEAAALRHVTERYLAAFGPAGVDDLMAYAGRRGSPARWKKALTELDERVTHFVDEEGRELFGLADAPRPGADADAPPRLLARWDSLLLSHAPAHRDRVIAEEQHAAVYTKNADVLPTFLVDGMVAGTWEMDISDQTASVTLSPFRAPKRRVCAGLETEADRLLRALAADHPQQHIHVRM